MTTTAPSPSSPPIALQANPITWLQKNLFSTWYNSLITIVLVVLLTRTVVGFCTWAITAAKWNVIAANLALFLVGQFPVDQYWRVYLLLGMITVLSGLSWGSLARRVPRLFSRPVLVWAGIIAVILVSIPVTISYRLLLLAIEGGVLATAWIGRYASRRTNHFGVGISVAWSLSFFVMLWLIAGGFGLKTVNTTAWGGLLLTMFLAITSSIIAFPFGILLALGRQSNLPILRWVSTVFIELVRGIPLTALLFVGAVMLPLFLPSNLRTDLVVRTLIALTMFCAAYLAETIRGGLQAIPRGQREAASALGLNTPLSLALIVLPQVLKISIPPIVGLFIQMVQETTLVSIVGLSELLRISRSILSNPNFIGRYAEVYLFIGLLYWAMCYLMSLGSRKLEERLNQTN